MRIVGIVEHKEPGFWGVGQPPFDTVDILIDLEDARELREGLLNTLLRACVDPEYAPVSE
jgi:hypothetical protein